MTDWIIVIFAKAEKGDYIADEWILRITKLIFQMDAFVFLVVRCFELFDTNQRNVNFVCMSLLVMVLIVSSILI